MQLLGKIQSQLSQIQIPEGVSDNILQKRLDAISFFNANGLPSQKLEEWRNINFDAIFNDNFVFPETQDLSGGNLHLKCNIPNLDTKRLPLLNGSYNGEGKPLEILENGVIMGSLKEAMKQFPDLVKEYFGAYSSCNQNGFLALNTALAIEGIFIYIPKNVSMEQPLQILNVINSSRNLFIQTRNLIILEENSRLKLIQCDDSYNQQKSFSNHVTEIFVRENAFLEHCKLQNLNDESGLLNLNYWQLEQNAQMATYAVTLNGGLIRNHTDIALKGNRSNAQVNGLYLMDKNQKINNYVFIDHAVPDCQSKELFKGILDENAQGVFNGHILVRKNASGTQAFQNNKNLLLTSKSKIITKPFLEIYNDDVKCSHGAATGQLDENALFYLRSRGISEHMARTLLMQAFCDEVISKISIESLRNRLKNIIQKRLRGELSICEQCSLHCSTMDCSPDFSI